MVHRMVNIYKNSRQLVGIGQIYQTIHAALLQLESTEPQDIEDNESESARLLSTIEETMSPGWKGKRGTAPPVENKQPYSLYKRRL